METKQIAQHCQCNSVLSKFHSMTGTFMDKDHSPAQGRCHSPFASRILLHRNVLQTHDRSCELVAPSNHRMKHRHKSSLIETRVTHLLIITSSIPKWFSSITGTQLGKAASCTLFPVKLLISTQGDGGSQWWCEPNNSTSECWLERWNLGTCQIVCYQISSSKVW